MGNKKKKPSRRPALRVPVRGNKNNARAIEELRQLMVGFIGQVQQNFQAISGYLNQHNEALEKADTVLSLVVKGQLGELTDEEREALREFVAEPKDSDGREATEETDPADE